MNIWQAIILGIVEGITEFLPVSSTGHLVLVSYILNIPQTEFVKTFEIVIQGGAIFAAIILYWKRILHSKKLSLSVLLAFLPTAIIGFALYKIIKDVFIGNIWITVVSLVAGGIVLWFIDRYAETFKEHTSINNMRKKQSILIGIGQSISVIPGVSRSGATIVTSLLTGLTKKDAVEFSFLLAIPTILSASLFDLMKSSLTFSSEELLLLSIGSITAFIAAYISMKWFISYISNHSFALIAFYRIAIAILFILVFVLFPRQ